MEVVDRSMTVMDDVDAVVNMDSVATSAHRTNAAGTDETVNNSLDRVDHENVTETVKDEDVTGGRVIAKCTISVTITDNMHNMRDVAESADTVGTEDSADSADLTDSRSMDIDDHEDSMDESAKDDSNACESDGDCTGESTCLEAMTPCGQDHYLRLGDTPRRRSALRLSRIIARQQLLRRLSQGRNSEVIMCPSVIVGISV